MSPRGNLLFREGPKNDKVPFVIGFAIGVGVGAVIAVCFPASPQRGITTQFYDDNRNGTNDSMFCYKDGLIEASWQDRDSNGQPDLWHAYKSGVILWSQGDDNFNGTIDTWYNYSNGMISSVEVDQDEDGLVEMMEWYKFTKLARQEWYTSSTTLCRRVFFDRGIKKEEYVDTDSDGTIDTRIRFDNLEREVDRIPIAPQRAVPALPRNRGGAASVLTN